MAFRLDPSIESGELEIGEGSTMSAEWKSLVLASSSPRRRELLETLGYRLDIRPPEVDESAEPGESIHHTLLRVATLKARAVARSDDRVPILAADTVVVLSQESESTDDRVLGKPGTNERARTMLAELSGKTHRVLTGFAVILGESQHAQIVTSEVRMRAFGPEAIEAYVASGEPLDKAGGYGIQARGAALVAGVHGSYSNVVGLPLDEVVQRLTAMGH